MKKRVIVVSGLSLTVFARRILCWQDEAISHTVAVTWPLCNRRCTVERSATVYSSARLQLPVPRLGYGREHNAISIFAYPPLHALSLLPGAARQWLGAGFSFYVPTQALSWHTTTTMVPKILALFVDTFPISLFPLYFFWCLNISHHIID